MHDLRLAFRSLAKSPGFTLISVLTLALGIGLVTVQLSFVYGALVKGLPFEGSERIQTVLAHTASGSRQALISLRHFAILEERQHAFDILAAYRGNGINVSSAELLPRRYPGVECTAGVFSITGIRPQLGRTILPEDNQTGAPRVLVLSDDVWRSDFGAKADVLGQTVRIDGEPATIIGVMPAGFAFPLKEKVWTNLPVPPAAAQSWFNYVDIIGRLRADTTLAQARSELAVLATEIARQGPQRENFGARLGIMPYVAREVGMLNKMLWTLLVMVGAVLVLACVNVANLLYVRAVRQRHEFAVRLALGASGGRLVRQTLVLSTMLAGVGAIVGALLAAWAVPVVNYFLDDPKKPYWVILELDGRVLAVVVGLTLVVGILAGLVPALRALRLDPLTALRDGGQASTALGFSRTSRWLSVAQIVLSAAVLVVAVVLSRGVFQAGANCYPGDASCVLVASTVFQPKNAASKSARAAQLQQFRADLLRQAAALPGVEVAAITTRDPDRRAVPMPIEIARQPVVAPDAREQFSVEHVSADYFRLFGINALRGRLFGPAGGAGAEPVAIINESFARRHWPGQDPIGQRIRIEDAENSPQWRAVVGVVPTLPMDGIALEHRAPGVYLPLSETGAYRLNLLLRSRGEPLVLTRPLQTLLQTLAPDQPFQSILTLEGLIDVRLRLTRLLSTLAMVFGLTAALLATLGIFTVTAFLVERRRREFGVRIALGAPAVAILRLVLARGLVQLALGLGVGLALGWMLNQPLQGIPMFRTIASVRPLDFVLVALAITGGVLFACWLPARRATRINPIEALRME